MMYEDMVRMLRESGVKLHETSPPDAIERFAALVAAAEREACAKVCESEAAKLGQSREALAIGICAAAIRARGG